MGRTYQNINPHLTPEVGFSDQELVPLGDALKQKVFLAPAQRVGGLPAGKLNVRGMPVYTCRNRPLAECLDALG